MASTKISVPLVLELGNIVYSENFGGNNLGIVIRNGISAYKDAKFDHETGAVYYIDKKDVSVISSGSLRTIEKHIGSPLISMGMKMEMDAEFEKNRHKSLSEDVGEYFRYILEQAENEPTIKEHLLLARNGFKIVEGGRRHRRKSRRHKKPNHRHKKRRITQRYKK